MLSEIRRVSSHLLKSQLHEMDKHTQKIRRLLLTNSLSVLDHLVGLVLKGLTNKTPEKNILDVIATSFLNVTSGLSK